MLELKNVTKTYKTKAGEVNALNGISLTFPSSGLIFISGKSGCGKTTLLNVIGGLDGIDGGEIYIQDKEFSTFSAKEYDSYRNTVVGFIFQEYNLLAEYTVEYNIRIAMELQGRPVDEDEFEKLLKDVEIEELRHRKPSELSGGQRQRIAIARALVKQPRIIMADEPTGALDSTTGTQVLDLLKKLSKDKLVIVVSHDREFAEKYADRIIRLVDGMVVEDITYTEKEIDANVSEQANALIVKEGSVLSETEKDVLAKAVKERKKIEFTENLSFRDKQTTGEVVRGELEPIAFKKSKMKLKSSVYLGVKSLAVKPIRLVITIIISALAFAVFGLFDTIANFKVQSILKNALRESGTTMVATANYVVDHDSADQYNLKVSDQTLQKLAAETGGEVKGIFNFQDNTLGAVSYSLPIFDISDSKVVVGQRYYSREFNGFIEFNGETEIAKDGKFKKFDYKLVSGRYPALIYDGAVLREDSLYEIAISTYLADSIVYYLNGNALSGKNVTGREDLLGCTLSTEQGRYKIVGLIDCGKIPEKYDEIKASTPYYVKLNGLFGDYDTYINSGAQKCFFVADGFMKEMNSKKGSADICYVGSVEWALGIENVARAKQLANYVYNSETYGLENILLFSNSYPTDGKITLKDDEILIHFSNLENMFSNDIYQLENETDKNRANALIRNMGSGSTSENQQALQDLLELLGKNGESVSATIDLQSVKTEDRITKSVKIVGVYVGVDTNNPTTASRYKLMMNSRLMKELNVYSAQGDYSHVLFSRQSVTRGLDAIMGYLTAEEGLSLTWYNNSVLTVIQENEWVIRQAADLFLYVALALAVFSVFMLYNYISTSIANKRRSVGVLRGLGAGGKDILITFLSESLIIGVINGILANVFSAFGCTLVNSYIMNTMNIFVSFALFGVRQILIIAGISLLTAVISSALPIIKISKKKPVDLIRRP